MKKIQKLKVTYKKVFESIVNPTDLEIELCVRNMDEFIKLETKE